MTYPALKVALIGGKGVGKTTFAQALVDWYGFTKLSFADPIKFSMIHAINAFLIDQGLPGALSMSDLYAHKDSFRLGMQWLGTDIVRDLCAKPNHWVDNLCRRVDAIEHYADEHRRLSAIVVDDVRFLNEADRLRDRGFLLVRLRRHGYGGNDDLHKSEQEHRQIEPHLTISIPHHQQETTVEAAKEFAFDLIQTYADEYPASPVAEVWNHRFGDYEKEQIEQKLRQIGGITSREVVGW